MPTIELKGVIRLPPPKSRTGYAIRMDGGFLSGMDQNGMLYTAPEGSPHRQVCLDIEQASAIAEALKRFNTEVVEVPLSDLTPPWAEPDFTWELPSKTDAFADWSDDRPRLHR